MTITESILTVLTVVFGTMLTRFLPFLIFSKIKTPPYITYLGTVLPYAVIGLLIVYCLKDFRLQFPAQSPRGYCHPFYRPSSYMEKKHAAEHWRRHYFLYVSGSGDLQINSRPVFYRSDTVSDYVFTMLCRYFFLLFSLQRYIGFTRFLVV